MEEDEGAEAVVEMAERAAVDTFAPNSETELMLLRAEPGAVRVEAVVGRPVPGGRMPATAVEAVDIAVRVAEDCMDLGDGK